MTGFLGYDNDRLLNLRSAIDRALLELSDLHISDPEANATLQLVRRAHVAIADRCLPSLRALLSCQAITAYVPARLQSNDIAVTRLATLQLTQGWAVVTDPLSPRPHSMTIEDAQALGWALSQTHLKSLTKNAEIKWLETNLAEIAQRPELVAALVANMTDDAWTHLCDQLGDDRITLLSTLTVEGRLSDDNRSRLASIDAVFTHLGTIMASGTTTALNTMHPYAAAMLVQHLHLSAGDLASLSVDLIRRYRVGGWADVQRAGPGTGDLLMHTMLDTPGAPAAFMLLIANDPAVVLDSAHNHALAEQLLLEGTNPANITTQQAGTVVPALARYLLSSNAAQLGFYGQPVRDNSVLAVDLIAPWLLQFTATHQDDWHFTNGEGARLLATIVDDGEAFARLSQRRTEMAAGLSATIATSGDSGRHAVEDLAAILGLIDVLARQHNIARTAEVRQLWNIGFALISVAAAQLPGGAVATVGAGVALAGLRKLLVQHGIAPKSAQAVEHDTLYALDWQTTVAAATVVCLTFDEMTRDGRIATSTPPPPLPDPHAAAPGARYSSDFETWLDTANLGSAAAVLFGLKQTLASTHETERDAAELATG